MRSGAEPIVNTTLTKATGVIDFHIFESHFTSSDSNYEEEVAATKELMESRFGEALVDLSWHVFDKFGVFGHEEDSMMLLYQLAMFANQYHNDFDRHKRSIFEKKSLFNKKNIKESTKLPDTVQEVCDVYLADHDSCSSDLATVNSSNVCVNYEERRKYNVHRFSVQEIQRGCYGLCGPWCTCWVKVCGDCCWHPGCYKHDVVCENPNSVACKLGKGMVYGRGLHTC